MPDEIKPDPTSPTPSAPSGPLTAPPPPSYSMEARKAEDRGIGHVSMAEEMDSARWILPPIVPILIGLAGVAIVLGIVAFVFRAKPTATGSIEKVIAAQQGDNVLVAIHVKFNNLTDELLHIQKITAELETADGKKLNDSAAPAADIDRYFQAFPELGEGRTTPLKEEFKIPANTAQMGMAIFAFPIDKAGFDKRKLLSMRIDFYDHAAMVVH